MNEFIESLKGDPKWREGGIVRALNQRAYFFRYEEQTGGVIAHDQGGYLMTKSEFMELEEGMQIFFKNHTDDEIKEYNIWVDRPQPKEQREEKPDKPIKSGWVYLVHGQGKEYKIGKTTRQPSERLAEFIPKLPFDSHLVCTIEAVNPNELEEYLHIYFDNKRIRGEWFELTDEDVNWIKGGAV
jgi:hypothetical protein